MDSYYGTNTALRDGITALELELRGPHLPNTSAWTEGKSRFIAKRACAAARSIARRRTGADQALALNTATGYDVIPSGGVAKLCWCIDRDYQELKQEVGLGHFGGTRGSRRT